MKNSVGLLARDAVIYALVLLAIALSPPARAADSTPRFVADPAGVSLDLPASTSPVETGNDGVKWLLVADRLLLTGKEPLWHRQIRYQVAQESGLETAGQFSIQFQPAYQQVEIHAIDVVREGRRLDRRAASRVDVLRRESDLESRLLDGSLTVNVTIPDLRVGDIIEYRFSIIGDNPVFGQDYYDSYTARYDVPLGMRHFQVQYPRSMPLRWRAPKEFKTQRNDVGEVGSVTLYAAALPAVEQDDNTPSTFFPYGRIELTTAPDWAAVATWGAPLYPRRFTDRTAVAPLVTGLKLDPDDPVGSAIRATAFVQGEVRYTGVDMGLNSHAPNSPERVLERRFGDCKDKTTLLIALLAEAGVVAEPVLVNSSARRTVSERLPSPLAFDHVIVRAHLDGREVWIDPTLSRERGDFGDRRSLLYGVGLPLAAGSRALVDIPAPRPMQPNVEVDQSIALTLEAKDISAAFDVGTTYRQAFADDTRSNFSSNGASKIGKDYLTYMQGFYEGLSAKREPQVQDHEASFQVDEQYNLRWNRDKDGEAFGIVLFQVLDWLPKIDQRQRHSPLALTGPRYGRHTIRTTVTNNWSIRDDDAQVSNAYFRLHRKVRVVGNELVITADWYREADEIPAAAVAKVRADVEKARELLQYNVDLSGNSPEISGLMRDWIWPLATLPVGMALLAGLWLMRRRWTFAAMFFRPRQAVAEQMAGGGLGLLGVVLFFLSIAADIWFEIAQRMGQSSAELPIALLAVAMVLGLTLRWAIVVGLLKMGFHVMGTPTLYGRMWRTLGQSMAPFLLLTLVAILGMGFDVSVLADEESVTGAELPAILFALFWIAVGGVWSLVALVNASAASVGTTRGRAMGALLLAGLGLILLAIPFVLLYFAGTLRA